MSETMRVLDTYLWDFLLHQSGNRSFMDAAARREWDRQVDQGETPPLNYETIKTTFEELLSRDKREEMLEAGVINLFRGLSWDYKSNSPVKLGPRIIVNHLVDSTICTWPNHDKCNILDDLSRVLHLYDSKPEPDVRNGWWPRIKEVCQVQKEVSTDYLRVKWFKNGNGHVYILRDDLRKHLNQIIAKHYPGALPAAR